VLSTKMLQHQVFLEHVKLAEYLGAVEFDAGGMASDGAVVSAWGGMCGDGSGGGGDGEVIWCLVGGQTIWLSVSTLL
jgi:hypothetical protein